MAISSREVIFVAIVLAFATTCNLGTGAPPPAKKPAPKSDLERIQGKWRATGGMLGGKTESAEGEEEEVWTFKDRKLTTTGQPSLEMRITLNPSESPSTIDFVIVKDDGEDLAAQGQALVILGIYSIEGDTLTICMSTDTEGEMPGDRPTKFIGDGQFGLITFKRIGANVRPVTTGAKSP